MPYQCKFCNDPILWEESNGKYTPINPQTMARHKCGDKSKPKLQTKKELIHGQLVDVTICPAVPDLATNHKSRWHYKDRDWASLEVQKIRKKYGKQKRNYRRT